MKYLFNCYNPKTIINAYTGKKQVVRCGKCNACRNERAAHWVTRCDMESACHKYTWFVNLSYNDYNVSQIVRLRSDDADHIVYIDSQTGELIDSYDIKEQFEQKDIEYCHDTKVLNILEKRDIQLFIKRLRYYFDETDKDSKLRYYVAGEYGPRTYRPHFHCLIWFDSERCNEQFEILLHKAWTYGNIYEPHPVTGSAAQYVASYINSASSLPKIYLHKGIRPFTLKSSCPAIGSMYSLLESEQDIITRGTSTFRRFNSSSNSFEDVPFWRSLENRLYPRCQRFGSLSHDDRITLYRKMAEFVYKYDFLSCRQIAQRIQWEYLDSRFPEVVNDKVIYKRGDSFLHRYFFEISHKTVYKYRFTHQPAETFGMKGKLPFLPLDSSFSRPFTGIKVVSRDFCFDSLVRFVRTTSRFLHNASRLNFTIEEYLFKIESYYDKKSHLKWLEDYKFQNEYFSQHPKWHWIYFDKSFFDKVTTTDITSWSLETLLTLQYLFDSDKLPLVFKKDDKGLQISVLFVPPMESLPSYQSFKLLHDKIAHELIKQKSNNDYALLHKDKFGNIIKYQDL